jgi:DMSO/TMAO reductase YedYZ molybdopterin-dependent catalytic subunit
MNTRRQFVVLLSRFLVGLGMAVHPAFSFVGRAVAAAPRKLLPKETDLQSLKNEHPAALDTRQLEIMPVESFRTMGSTDHEVSLDQWRLEVTGKVKRPLKLTYAELLALPAVEEKVLLICPGIFTIYAAWKGVFVREILGRTGLKEGATHVTLHGPPGPYEKVEEFTLADVDSGKILLAYGVNGRTLPQKHGFPLRAVAADRFGSDWVKFVYKLEAR